MRRIIKRILQKYGYPSDRQARATDLVLEQAEVRARTPLVWQHIPRITDLVLEQAEVLCWD